MSAGSTIIQLELWALITFLCGLLLAFIGAVFTGAKVLLAQFEKRQQERFAEQDKARVEGSALLRKTLDGHLEQEKEFRAQLQELERRFLSWSGSTEGIKDDVDKRIDDHAERLSRLETQSEQAPTHDDLGNLHDRINDLAKSVNTLTGEFAGVKNVLGLIHQHLLTNGGKS